MEKLAARRFACRPSASRYAFWLAFLVLIVTVGWSQPAWDLSAGYVAGRLVASGDVSDLYARENASRAAPPGPAWQKQIAAGGISDGVVTPYIQTPLWAWLLSPVASRLQFAAFARLFSLLSAAATIATIFAAARQWSARLTAPGWQAGLLSGLFITTPFLTSIVLGQTHMLLLCITVYASIAALRGKNKLAGFLLALAACVKITPAWIALTWLVTGGRTKAVLSFVISTLALLLLSVWSVGPSAFLAYVSTLKYVAGNVPLSFNNDSLATLLLSRHLNADTAFNWQTVPCPPWVAAVSIAATVSIAILGGLIDRQNAPSPPRQVGTIITLVGATAFTPLAWNHYFVVLILPVMLILDDTRIRARWFAVTLAFAVLALNLPPLAFTLHYNVGAPLSTVALRSHFWAAMLCLFTLAWCSGSDLYRERRSKRAVGQTQISHAATPPNAAQPASHKYLYIRQLA